MLNNQAGEGLYSIPGPPPRFLLLLPILLPTSLCFYCQQDRHGMYRLPCTLYRGVLDSCLSIGYIPFTLQADATNTDDGDIQFGI